MELATYSEWAIFLSLCFIVHNLVAAYYAYALFQHYLSLSLKNMHSVEDTLISALYEQAEQLGIINHCRREELLVYYYTRRSFFRNWCEMLGSSNCLRWVVPLPFFGRQNHELQSNDPWDIQELAYMRLDRDACKMLANLEAKVETYLQ